MDLVTAWRAQLLRASAATLVVPIALFAALLLVGIGGGGFGSLGSLGQLVSGPAAAPRSADPGERLLARAATELARADAAAVARDRRSVPGPGAGPSPSPRGQAPEPRTRPPAGPRGRRPQRRPGGGTPGRGAPSAPAPGAGPAPPRRGTLDPVRETVRPVTEQLPAPAGPTLQGLVDSLTDTVRGGDPPRSGP